MSDYGLKDKVALITGASTGIGRATAMAFAREGAKVAIIDINAEGASSTVAELQSRGAQAITVQADISQGEQVKAAIGEIVQQLGRIDVACNNAGVEIEADPLVKTTEDVFDKVMSVNVKGMWLSMKYEIEQMLAQGDGGAIVNIASVAGLIGSARQPIYTASKHAVVGLTKAAALEYGRKGIRVNSVCPGVVNTGMTDRAIELDPKREKTAPLLHPIGRIAEPEEVAEAALFLCSGNASFVLGHQFLVDGGLTAT